VGGQRRSSEDKKAIKIKIKKAEIEKAVGDTEEKDK
jgi:hypothetical protein